MAESKKITKKEFYAALKEMVETVEVVGDIASADVIAFIDREVELIEAKAEKAKARAAEKRADGDQLREVVKSVLTDELQTIDAIFAQVEGEDLTKAKITSRLSQLVKADIAEKESIKVDGRKVMGYKLK